VRLAEEILQAVEIRAPIEQVWAEITKLGGKQRAMMDSTLDTRLEPGAPLYYRAPDAKRVFIVGRVLEVEPPRRFAHTYRLTTQRGEPTVVIWELQETAAGTRVTLTHTGWPEGDKRPAKHAKVWRGILEQLRRVVEQGDVSAGTKARYAAYRGMLWAMPKRTLAENVRPEPTEESERWLPLGGAR
jgi:uncharacterized protein YndB with AHSA1/START domain